MMTLPPFAGGNFHAFKLAMMHPSTEAFFLVHDFVFADAAAAAAAQAERAQARVRDRRLTDEARELVVLRVLLAGAVAELVDGREDVFHRRAGRRDLLDRLEGLLHLGLDDLGRLLFRL